MSVVNEGDSTVKTTVRPFDVGAAWSLCECTIESTYRAEGRALWVSHTLRNARTDRFPYPASPQELPALYSTFPAHRLFTYDGSNLDRRGAHRDYDTLAALQRRRPELARHGALGRPGRRVRLRRRDLQPGDCPLRRNSRACRPAVRAERLHRAVGFRGARPQHRPRVPPTGCGGDARSQTRVFASANRPAEERPDWEFAASREHWWYGNASDEGWPVTGSLRVRLEQPDPWLWSPEGAFRAEDVPRIYVRAAFHGLPPSERGELFFSRAGDGFWPRGEDPASVYPSSRMASFDTYVFRLALNSGYSGWIKRPRYDPVLDGRLGARMELDYVSSQQRSRARTLTFGLRGHLRAAGRVSVPDDLSPDCLASVPLVAERRDGDRWKPFAQTRTGSAGGYSVRLPDRPGRYRVRLPESSPGERCLAAASGSLVHRHRR